MYTTCSFVVVLVASCLVTATCTHLFEDCATLSYDLVQSGIHARLRSALNYPKWHREQCGNLSNDWNSDKIGSVDYVTAALTNTSFSTLRCAAISRCWSLPSLMLPGIDLIIKWRHCPLVVVTANFGGRHVLSAPPATSLPLSTCFVAFVDEIPSQRHPGAARTGSRWQYVKVNLTSFNGDARTQSRIWKLLLPQLFPESRWSLWIDANLALRYDPWVLVANLLWQENARIAGAAHYIRFAYHHELDEIVRLGMMSNETALRQREHYTNTGMAMNNTGLLDGKMVLRDHKSIVAPLVSCLWWHQYTQFPASDTAGFSYVTYKLGFRPDRSHEEMEAMRTLAEQAYHATNAKTRFVSNVGFKYRSDMLNEIIKTYPVCKLHDVALERDHRSETRKRKDRH
jgi:hypothetical protein